MSLVVSTEFGRVEGAVECGLNVFRNIPFAAPPFGAQRFRPPQPPEKWSGIRPCIKPGPGAPQPALEDGDEIDALYFNAQSTGPDCLTLEIWTPDCGANRLPVMVWIHGGGYLMGSGSAMAHSGRSFARDGIVHVSINYRLGVEGFVYLGEGTDNLGLRDQVAALEWVQRNISSFGGDPSNVTLFGQSAGGVSVMNLLCMPSARGLFARAIAQSGSPAVSVSPEEASGVTRRLAKHLGIKPTLAAFEATTVPQTVAATLPFALKFANPLRSGAQCFQLSPYRAVHATASLPEPPIRAAASRANVPLIMGTTRNETIGFLKVLGRSDVNPIVGWYLQRLLGINASIRDAYRSGPRRLDSRLALIEAAWTDRVFRMPSLRLADARAMASPSVPTWLYEFRWESPGLPPGLASNHALEIPFVRDDLQALKSLPGSEAWLGTQPPQSLATAMHAAWTRFAQTGDPGWPAYDLTRRQTMIFDALTEVLPDAAAPERQAWMECCQ